MLKSIAFAALSIFLCLVWAAPPPLDDKQSYNGRGTWFDAGLGACGWYNVNSDPIVAISQQIYDSGSHCSQYVRVTDLTTGRTEYGLTADECPECAPGDLDMSTGLFQKFADLDVGVLSIDWNFMPPEWAP